MNWRSRPIFLLTCVVLPPAGLVMLALRSGTPLAKKFLGAIAITLIGVAHLVFLWGMRLELAGSGARPIVRFGTPEQHYREIERSRAKQARIPDPASAVPAAIVPVSSNSPEPAPAPSVATAYWTDFRGPNRDGVYPRDILTAWPSKGLERLWKQPIGGGYSSFVFGGGRAYTIEQRRDQEFVAAYDPRTGKELWSHSYRANFQESMGGDGPRATPTYHDGLLYSLGASGELRVLDAATGKVKWLKNILSDTASENLMWGMCGAPLIVEEKVILQAGKSIAAYNRLTGARIWKSLDDQGGYASPMLVTLGGKRHIITMMAKRAVGVAVEDGKLLWEYPWVTEYDVNSAQPVVIDANRIVISSGYGHGAALLEIKASGSGLEAVKVWENNRLKNRFNSSVHHQGHVYGLDENILACMRVSDGQLMWKGGRYGYGQLLLAGGHLVLISEDGELALIRATPDKHTEVAKFDAISGKTWNVPAMEDGLLLVRNGAEMAAFRIGK